MSLLTTSFQTPEMPEGFRIMLAGNLGDSQNLDAVGNCMKLLKDCSELKWVFVGDGSRKAWLDEFIRDNDLSDCAVTLGRYPGETMPAFFKKADAMLVTLRGGFVDLDVTVPARVQSYMSAGKPVLAMIGKGGADLINESDCGYAVAPSDYRALAEIIRNQVLTDKDGFKRKGENGRLFFEKHFLLEDCITNLEIILKS